MKRIVLLLAVVFSLVMAGGAFAAETGKLDLKVGDELYVCGCGKSCDCNTMSMKPGKCTCAKPMVKGKVTKVDGDVATIKTSKGEQAFKMVGLYKCGCGPECNCNTISQKPGKCACGKPMVKVDGKQ